MSSSIRRLLILLPVLLLLGGLAVVGDWWFGLPETATATYVGRQSCAACHTDQTHAWTGSDHDLAMDLATDEFVLGDFNDKQFVHQGVTSRLFKRDGQYMVHTEGPDGQMHDYPIKYTFGVRPLQQYMVELPDGRVQVLRISWDTEAKRWFYMPPPDVVDERIMPDDPLHWTGPAQNWNHTCAECHSTNLEKNYDLKTDTYHTSFSEIDVSCESCHGPASLHVQLAEAWSPFWDRHRGYGLVHLKAKDPKAEVETCAVCHSRRSSVHPDFRPGNELLDYYEPALLSEGLYHADGQILDEVYVYGSFLQSKMYHEDVRCTDCHDPHTTKLKFQGNRLCAQCHTSAKYDTPTHHHHPVGSVGAACVECHMPATTYMVVDPRRDHSFRVPRPDLTVRLGTPNACNGCHTKSEETPEWAADKVREWFGDTRAGAPHWAVALDAGRRGTADAEPLLVDLARRRKTPGIVKATALALLAQHPGAASRSTRQKAIEDEDPLSRATAVRFYPALAPEDMLRQLGPLLSDPVRIVRNSAALRVAPLPRNLLTRTEKQAFDRTVEEYKQGQLVHSDRAAAHLNVGNLQQNLGQMKEAVRSFEAAIRLEPYLTGPRSNLAALFEQMNHGPDQIKRLRNEELGLLKRDLEYFPDNPHLKYQYGLTLYLVGRLDEAAAALNDACRLAPTAYDYRLALTLLLEKQEEWSEALESAAVLGRLRPNDPVAGELMRRIGAAAAAGSQ